MPPTLTLGTRCVHVCLLACSPALTTVTGSLCGGFGVSTSRKPHPSLGSLSHGGSWLPLAVAHLLWGLRFLARGGALLLGCWSPQGPETCGGRSWESLRLILVLLGIVRISYQETLLWQMQDQGPARPWSQRSHHWIRGFVSFLLQMPVQHLLTHQQGWGSGLVPGGGSSPTWCFSVTGRPSAIQGRF